MAINRYSKQYLRKFYLDRRKRLTSAERMQLVTQMTLHFDAIPLKVDAVLHVFLPISRHFEPDTLIIKKFLQHKHPKMTFVVSKTLWETGQLEHYHWDEQMQFEENRLGIPEPVSGQIM